MRLFRNNKLILTVAALLFIVILSFVAHIGFWLICIAGGYVAGFASCHKYSKFKANKASSPATYGEL